MSTSRLTLIPLLALVLSCGSGGGTPAAPSTPTGVTVLPAGTLLSVVSGETDLPVADARVVVAGRELRTDGSGHVSLTASASAGAQLDIVAPGFLDRQTLLPSSGETRFSLWPRGGADGFDENMTAELVYTSGAYCCPAEPGRLTAWRLTRMHSGSAVSIGIPDAWRGHRPEEVVQEAIDDVNGAAEGRVAFHLAAASLGDVTITVNPTGQTPQGKPAAAYFMAAYDGSWTRGGDVVLTSPYYATLSEWPASWWGMLRRNVAHELGHCLGLQHTTVGDGLMTVGDISSLSFREYVARRPSPAEVALLRLAYLRNPGNAYPDNDRSVRPTAGRRTELVCALPPVP